MEIEMKLWQAVEPKRGDIDGTRRPVGLVGPFCILRGLTLPVTRRRRRCLADLPLTRGFV